MSSSTIPAAEALEQCRARVRELYCRGCAWEKRRPIWPPRKQLKKNNPYRKRLGRAWYRCLSLALRVDSERAHGPTVPPEPLTEIPENMSSSTWECLQELQTWAARWEQPQFIDVIKRRVAQGATPAELAEEIHQSTWYVLRMWKSRFGSWISDAERGRSHSNSSIRANCDVVYSPSFYLLRD
jgi:hypothetical protein